MNFAGAYIMKRYSYKTARLLRTLIIIALGIAFAVSAQNIIDFIKAQNIIQKTGFKPGTPEYAASLALGVSDASRLKYAVCGGYVFAISVNEDRLDGYVVLTEDENGSYGQNTPSLEDFDWSENPLLSEYPNAITEVCWFYKTDGKYIAEFPVYACDTNGLPIFDLDLLKVYDSEGNAYPALRGNNLSLYYDVRSEPYPDDYKLFIEYAGKRYTLFDQAERSKFEVITE